MKISKNLDNLLSRILLILLFGLHYSCKNKPKEWTTIYENCDTIVKKPSVLQYNLDTTIVKVKHINYDWELDVLQFDSNCYAQTYSLHDSSLFEFIELKKFAISDSIFKWNHKYIKNGIYIQYYPNGKVRYLGFYKNDQLDGQSFSFDEEGNILGMTLVKDRERIGSIDLEKIIKENKLMKK